MRNEYILFSDCKVVEGYEKSAIYDLRRGTVSFIPDTLSDILIKHNGFPYSSLKKEYPNDHETIDEYLEFLLSHEYIFKTKKSLMFEDIDSDFETPFIIDNIIIDNDASSNHDFGKIKEDLDAIGCPNILFRFYCKKDADEIVSILDYFQKSRTRDVTLMLPYQPYLTKELKKNLYKIRMVSEIILHHAPSNKTHTYQDVTFVYLSGKITDETHCGNINIRNFHVNMKMFHDSKNYNTCLHKKISIDSNGYIKNCPSSSEIFGNHSTDSLLDAVNKKGFKSKWYIKKDDIDSCKICVFRYMCIDCRVYLSDPLNLYSKPLKCKYNVYEENDEDNLRI